MVDHPEANSASTRVPVVAGAALGALLLSTSRGYGPFRDELYFIAAGRHLAWAYPDVPFITPLIARATGLVAGDSLIALRVWPAACMVAIVFLCAHMATLLGGGRLARAFSAAGVASAPIVMIFGHVFHYAAFDMLAWSAAICMFLQILVRGNERWWLPLGVVVGVAYENKNLVGLLVLSLGVAVVLVGPRSTLRSKWLIGGAVVGFLLALPNVLWQLNNGRPELALARSIRDSTSLLDRALILPFQFALIGLPIAALFVAGVRYAWHDARLRSLVIGYAILLGIIVATGGKHYYAAGMLPFFVVSGAFAIEDRLNVERGRRRRLTAAIAVNAVISAFIALPLVPVGSIASTPVGDFYPDVYESVGWPSFVSTVTRTWSALSPEERMTATILTENYGEAAAIDRSHTPLPQASSAHNAYWYWGPPKTTGGTVLVVGYQRAYLSQFFGDVTLAATINNEYGIENQEQGVRVWYCRGLLKPWKAIWPKLRHID